MTINTNTNPYYDDFDESKNYLKILFKPGYAVQARELTQLQTALQAQIDRLGKHIFEDGSLVLNGNTTTTKGNFVIVNSIVDQSIVGETFEGAVSGALGRVLYVEPQVTTSKVYFVYTSGAIFQKNETITSLSSIATLQIVDADPYAGSATLFSIEQSVFFVSGYFVVCNPQTIVLNDNEAIQINPDDSTSEITFTKRVGLQISSSIVTSVDDESLLDPAQGSNNFAAPGGDRYQIDLELVSISFDPQDPTSDTSSDFIELARFINSELVYKVTSSFYAVLEDNLARRTFDESGDYTVRPFKAKVIPHILNNEDKLSLQVGPGKAYVKGYEYETIANQYIDIDRALDFSNKNGRLLEVSYGDYLLIDEPSGSVNYVNHSLVNLISSGIVIGQARTRNIERFGVDTYKLYIYDFEITSSNYNVSQITSVATSDASWVANISINSYPDSIVTLYKGGNKTGLLPLPNKNIRSLLNEFDVSDTTYQMQIRFLSTINNYQASISPPGSQIFFTSDVNDYIVIDEATGSIVPVTNVSIQTGGLSAILTFAQQTAANITVFAPLNISEATHKNKALTSVTITTDVTNSLITLGYPDVFDIVSIIAKSSEDEDVFTPVTELFEFNNGQTDELYDHGWVQLRAGSVIPGEYDQLQINFRYFDQSSSNGFFSIDSYNLNELDYESIPTYQSTDGASFRLSDCLDFRPRRAINSTNIIGDYLATPQTTITVDYTFYVPRIDKLVLTKERKFVVVKGVAAETPVAPNDLYDAMTLYTINVPAQTRNTNTVSLSYVDNRRYTMRDIAKIDKRVQKVEYYTALSLLEKQAKDEVLYDGTGVERFKNGILVDAFSGHSVGDVEHVNYSCAIDKQNKILRPRFSEYQFEYKPNLITNAIRNGDLITLPYTAETFIDQPFATGSINLNPYMVFTWNGTVSLSPATDTWIDTQTRPDVVVNLNGENDVYTTLVPNVSNPASVGVVWNDWQTVVKGISVTPTVTNQTSSNSREVDGNIVNSSTSVVSTSIATKTDSYSFATGIELATSEVSTFTRDLGTRVVDTSIVPYIRSRLITFSAKNLKPVTVLQASFDNVEVSRYCTPAIELTLNNIVPEGAVRITSGSKSAQVALRNGNRVFIVLDANSANFVTSDTVVFYDISDVNLGSRVISSVEVRTQLITNRYGEIAGTFLIPNNESVKFTTGEKTFRLADSLVSAPSTAAEVKYVAQGMSQSIERSIVSTRVATASVNPVQQSTVLNPTSNTLVTSSTATSTVTTITEIPSPPRIICSSDGTTGDFSNGKKGKFEYEVSFGTTTGEAGISYVPTQKPVKYTLVFNGRTYTTGFVGSSVYNSQLAAIGLPNVVGMGSGELFFEKSVSQITTGILTVECPLDDTDWSFSVLCPVVEQPPVELPNPSYAVKARQTTITEGDTAIFDVTTSYVADDTVVYWTTTGTTVAADFSDGITAGSVIIKNNKAVINRPISADAATEGDELFEIVLRETPSGVDVANSATVIIQDTSKTGITYTIFADKASVTEGGTVTFIVNTTGFGSGTLYWTVNAVSGTVNEADFNDGVVSGMVTITNNTGTIVRRISLQPEVEGLESFELQLRTTSISGTVVATSGVVQINDLITESTYGIIADKTNVSEGSSVTFTVTTRNVPNGTTLYWIAEGGVVAADFTDNTVTGTFIINNNTATFTRNIAADVTTEGAETFTVSVRESSGGANLTTSQIITIADSSVDAVSASIICVTPIVSSTGAGTVESQYQNLITPKTSFSGTPLFLVRKENSNLTPGTYYWTVDHVNTDNSDFVSVSGSFTVNATKDYYTIPVPLVAGDEQSAEQFKVQLRSGSISGTVIATSNRCTINAYQNPEEYYIKFVYNGIEYYTSLGLPEGKTISAFLVGRNAKKGTYTWDVTGTGITSADFSGAALSGTFTSPGGNFDIPIMTNVKLAEDLSSGEGQETAKFNMYKNSSRLQTNELTIFDTSNTDPTLKVITPSSTLKEGSKIGVRLETANTTAGQLVYWRMVFSSPTFLDAEDFVGSITSGSIALNAVGPSGTAVTFHNIEAVEDFVEDHGLGGSSSIERQSFTVEYSFNSSFTPSSSVLRSQSIRVIDGDTNFRPYAVLQGVKTSYNVKVGRDLATQIDKTFEEVLIAGPYNGLGRGGCYTYVHDGNRNLSANVRYRPSAPVVTHLSGSTAITSQIEATISSTTPAYVAYRNGGVVTGDIIRPVTIRIPNKTPWPQNSGPQRVRISITWTYEDGDDRIPASLRTLTTREDITFNTAYDLSYADPVAQTFFVDSSTYPNGIFVNAIDLFFKKKSTTIPVEVQLRPTVNGYPSSTTIMPFASCVRSPEEISVSADASAATKFTFDNIVHLSPGEYSFVVICATDEYEIYTSRLGDFSIQDSTKRVTTQPTLGSLFKSQNSYAWTPVQEEDVMFKLYKCVFNTSSTGTVILDTDISPENGSVDYELFYTSGEVIDFADTDIQYSFRTAGTASWTNYQLGTNITFASQKTLSTPNSLQFRGILTTSDRNITPILDINRLSSVLVHNIVNNDASGETEPFNGNAVARYITRKVKLATGFESTDLKVYFFANKPSGTDFKVYYKVSTASDTYFDDNPWYEMSLEQAGTYAENRYVEYKYKTQYTDENNNTRALENGERFDTFSIKIVMLSSDVTKVPLIRDLRVIALDD